MTDKEYEQKKRECWEEFWDEISGNIDFAPGVDDHMKEHIYDTFDRAYALGKHEKDADTVIQGWVARDDDGDLFFYNDKPRREKAVWDEPQYWIGETQIDLDPNLFPDLTWESEPEPVEIIIKRKKK